MHELLGYEENTLLDQPITACFTTDTERDSFHLSLRDGEPLDGYSFAAQCANGVQRLLNATVKPQLYRGDPACLVTFKPLIEKVSLEHHQAVVDSIQELISYVDRDYSYRFVNDAYARYVGQPQQSIVGKKVWELWGEDFFKTSSKPFLDRGFKGEESQNFTWLTLGDNKRRYMRASYSPRRDENGDVIGVVVCVSDFTDRFEIECALQVSEEKYRQIFALESDTIVVYDGDTLRIIDCNDAALQAFGYTREQFLQLTAMDLSAAPTQTRQFLSSLVEAQPGQRYQRLQKRADGTLFDGEGSSSCFVISGKKYYCTVGRDITASKQIERDLQESTARFRAIVEASPLPLVISRLSDGCIVYANDKASNELRVSEDSIVGSDIKEIFRNENQRIEILEAMQRDGRVSDIQISFRGLDKQKRWLSCTASLITFIGEECVATGFIDVTESRELAKQLRYQASHDPLTGLVNRREFETRLRRVINTAKRQQSQHALCFIDLDQFKLVNDSCGHAAGDRLLRELAARLQGSLRRRDTLARLGGDEFAVIIEHCSMEEAIKVSETLRQTISELEFSWNTRGFDIGASIGLAAITADSEDASTVLKSADQACYAAKNAGRNRVHTFDQHFEEMQRRQIDIEWISQIKGALKDDRLCLYQQRAVPLSRTTHLPGYREILVRLIGEDQNIVLPGDILPIAERFDVATHIDRWVVDHALEWLESDAAASYAGNDIWALNLSAQSLSDDNFCNYLNERLSSATFATERLCFEITETAAINRLSETRSFLSTLRNCGCKIALDDFGSGHASYGYLKKLPVDFLKIDGMFIRDVINDKFDREFVRSINDLGHALGILTIAEFVETEEQSDTLIDIGVDYCQGFALNRPIPLTADTKKARHSGRA